MLYKMIYFSSHKFAFSNLCFSQFYEHFRQLREKYAFKLKKKYIMLIGSLSPIWWCTYIRLFLKKPLHSTELFKIFFSLLTLSTAFLQKACGPEKILARKSVILPWHVATPCFYDILIQTKFLKIDFWPWYFNFINLESG